MADSFKALAAADLLVWTPPPQILMTPLSAMAPAEALPQDTLVYKVPAGYDAIIRMIIVTSSVDPEQNITLRCYTDALGPLPLFGPFALGTNEWAEWTGTLTLEQNGEIRGVTEQGECSIAVYGMEHAV
jgi:hypothetical protein